MHSDVFDRWVRGRTCESCAIFKPNVFCFVLEWASAEDRESSNHSHVYLVHHLTGESEDRGLEMSGERRHRLAVDYGTSTLLMIAQGGNVFRHDDGGGRSEKKLTRETIVLPRAIRSIENHFYIAGLIRTVLQRQGLGSWECVTEQLKPSADPQLSQGFEDIDGFSESDMYAVGDGGDVFHYDGSTWTCIEVPTNKDFPNARGLASVCCASDGFVYIGGVCHRILRGRGKDWEILHQKETNRTFRQIVDFQGRIFAVDECGMELFEILSDGVVPVDTGNFIAPSGSFLCMAVGHGMLLTAGHASAVLFDGKTWRLVFGFERLAESPFAYSTLVDAHSAIDALMDELNDKGEE